jgi:hypothetical protein
MQVKDLAGTCYPLMWPHVQNEMKGYKYEHN